MIERFGQFGSGILALLGTIGLLVGALCLANKTIAHFYPPPLSPLAPLKKHRGWQVGLVTLMYLLLLGLLFWPSIDALKRHACKGANDFEECMDPSDSDY